MTIWVIDAAVASDIGEIKADSTCNEVLSVLDTKHGTEIKGLEVLRYWYFVDGFLS